jgi:hypothetical protein
LQAQWAAPLNTAAAAALRSDTDQQDAAMQLVYNTEIATQKVCAPATGDDALLLMLANRAHAAPALNVNASAVPNANASGAASSVTSGATAKAAAVLRKWR